VVKDEAKSDSFFGRSDNAAFAVAGVPSTTLSVTYVFGDYIGRATNGPSWITRTWPRWTAPSRWAAFGLADGTEEPQWNAENRKTEAYRKARRNRTVQGDGDGRTLRA